MSKSEIHTRKLGVWCVASNKVKQYGIDDQRNEKSSGREKQFIPINYGRWMIDVGSKRYFFMKKYKETELFECEAMKCRDEVAAQKQNEHCVICLENFHKKDRLIRLKCCSHVYHQDCVLQWLRLHKRCPLCQETVKTVKFGQNMPKDNLIDYSMIAGGVPMSGYVSYLF